MMRESELEKHVCDALRSAGWLVIKQAAPSEAGWPDRVAVSPTGVVWWVEFKSNAGVVRRLQEFRHRDLIEHRQNVVVLRPNNFKNWLNVVL